ncbi:MAG: S1 RNA-binding domain-containing protein, partial [Clostridia bacterium]|nr:S1 RNA-binding domain-containing protein [Clostridia bacterium]
TSVHPESYKAAEELLKLCGFDSKDVKEGKVASLPQMVETKGTEKTAEELGIGVPTLEDIVKELTRPGRDPRDELPQPLLRKDVMSIEDLTVGMKLKGTVRNVIDFGAFVDIGVHEDGLVHISRICDRFIKHPLEVLKVGDIVDVYVIGVDVAKKRISLSIKEPKNEK